MKPSRTQLFIFIILFPLILSLFSVKAQEEYRPFRYARNAPIWSMEPLIAVWESNFEPIRHIAETLYCYNISDPENSLQPFLASDWGIWSENETMLSINLRENVYFHDGTLFNSSVVAWNLERIFYFLDNGFMDYGYPGFALLENKTWIEISGASQEYNDTKYVHFIKDWEIIDEFIINITLPYRYPLIYYILSLECFVMVSPNSHPQDYYIENELVGTGPFKMVEFVWDGTIVFERFENYWREPANISTMEWIYVEGDYTRHHGMTGGISNRSYDMMRGNILDEFWNELSSDPTLIFKTYLRPMFDYIGFNTREIPINHRKAMAYAFNYADFHHDSGLTPMISPISPQIPYARTDLNIPYFNLTLARQYILFAAASENDTEGEIDIGNLTIDSSDEEWTERAQNLPIFTYNLSYAQGEGWDSLYARFASNMELIGVKIDISPLSGWDMYERFSYPENFNKLLYGYVDYFFQI